MHTETPSHESLSSAVDALHRETERLVALGESLGRREQEWAAELERLEQRRERTERSRRKLAARGLRWRRRLAAGAAGSRVAAGQAAPAAPEATATQIELEAELHLLRGQLAEAVGMLESLRDARRRADAEHRRQREQLEAELERCADVERELREQLKTASGRPSDDAAVDELRRELDAERIRCEELESQNASLAMQLAASQVDGQISAASSSQGNESLSWEERKAAILRQLHREDHDEPLDAGERESLREMLAKTDREIQRRDAEIAELQQLLEHQSTAVGDSVAVGAAAIAQMIDTDDLVREEREKLQAIKAEWQEKLRRAEIELSLERAKLARERRELEQKHADLEQQLAQMAELQSEAPGADQPRRRRWLTQLGISEED